MGRGRGWLQAAAGVAAALVGLGAAELAAAIFAPTASPVYVVGAAVIDLVPGPVKDAVVRVFGTGDKAFLLAVLWVLVAALAGLAGVLEARRPWTGRGIMLLGGAVAVAAALTRANASSFAVVPSALAAVVAAAMLPFLLRRVPRPALRVPTATPSRRDFLAWASGSAVVGLAAVIGGRIWSAAATAGAAARAAITLPKPARAAPAVPATASFDIAGLSPVVTPNDRFYRIDIDLQVPEPDPHGWTLRVDGMVEHPFTLSWDALLRLPLEEHDITLACVSNEVGGSLIGTARWLGYPVRLLLERAGVRSGADMVFSSARDGFTATTPLSALDDPGRLALLAVGMNGEPLPFEHGFPARLVVPGLYGYVSATKWVTHLEVSRFADRTSYWARRGWAQRAPIKQSSRIDVPRSGRRLAAGERWVAGVAWDQHVGIAGVEVQVDDGDWQRAELAAAIGSDTWVQWRWRWAAEPGDHRLRVRATNAQGVRQTSASADVLPDGATGWHTIQVTVA